MKVIEENKQKGIFIPSDEWDEVIKAVNSDSELYRLLNQCTTRSIFDLPISDIDTRLGATAISVTKQALENGFHTSHRTPETVQFLHRYDNGRIELIEIDDKTGTQTVLKAYQ